MKIFRALAGLGFIQLGKRVAVLASLSWSTSFFKQMRTHASFAQKLSRYLVAISCLATSRRKLWAQSGLGDRNIPSTVTCFPNCVLKF